MALHPPNDPSKLIFAPAGSEAHGQAAQFTSPALHRGDLDPTSPTAQFHAWFQAAQAAPAVAHPETCTLATAHLPSGRVSARTLYLKELDAAGAYVVYSNFATSRKAADLASNPRASLVFWWEALQRQVRVEGVAARVPREQSQTYYDTRVRGSRLGAWASRQSQVLEAQGDGDDGRAQLEGWVKEVEARFDGEDKIPVPEFWGGLRIVPDRDGEAWTLNRLSP
ncbi:pyridoxamine 5'-phosphate oxidase like protein [Verticillium longisporum]|uniref:Pyridoxamine 5'-phosphate oxidase like protein n=1 Tax=Verticillium longisporum TaxID=100787 RepID=A0A8I3AQR8_VERLO|nr:pyridoxamine 5'-phosphate oxidase like protein [Verticillium longisporum]